MTGALGDEPAERLAVLLVGREDRAEFRQAVGSLAARADVAHAADAAEAAAWLARSVEPPDVIVVAQTRPGEHRPESIQRLRRLAPLARVAVLLGSWCEGEMRTGTPLPGAVRVYWHQWLPRWETELDRLDAGHCPTWGLPLTAGEDERINYILASSLPKRRGVVVLDARADAAESLSEMLGDAGYATVRLGTEGGVRVQGASAVVWDGNGRDAPAAQSIQSLCRRFSPAPVVALFDFPRLSDFEELQAAGAACVVSKPYRVDDLLWQLDQAVRPGRHCAEPSPAA